MPKHPVTVTPHRVSFVGPTSVLMLSDRVTRDTKVSGVVVCMHSVRAASAQWTKELFCHMASYQRLTADWRERTRVVIPLEEADGLTADAQQHSMEVATAANWALPQICA